MDSGGNRRSSAASAAEPARSLDEPPTWTHPFTLLGSPTERRAVLLVHGFSGSPYEVHLLAQALHGTAREPRYHCAVPLLAGHHDRLATLAATGWRDWLGSAEAALQQLWQTVATGAGRPRLAVVGLSMGGLLALELARRYPVAAGADREAIGPTPEVAALCLLATPLSLPSVQERAIRLFAGTAGLRRLAVPKLFGADLREGNRPGPPLRPRGMPIRCLDSLLDLMAEVRPHLGEIAQPTLICHGVHDHTAPFASMAAIAAGLATPPSALRCVSLPRSYHLLPLDVEREIVAAEVAAHLATYL
jgi:carboxylesterase